MKLSLTFLLCLILANTQAYLRGDEEAEEGLWVRDLGGDDTITPSDDATSTDGGTSVQDCFSEVSTVQELNKGKVTMKDLQVGDVILTKSGKFQPVYAFAHREEDLPSAFFQFHSKDGLEHPLEITNHHLVYLHDKVNPVRAESVKVGDNLHTVNGPAQVTKITTVNRIGVYAPMTVEGTVVVDGVAASSYISFQKEAQEVIELGGIRTGFSHHTYVHMTLAPFRLLCLGVSNSFAEWYDEDAGMPQYIRWGVKLNNWVFQQTMVWRVLLLAVIIFLNGTCWIFEGIFGASVAPLAAVTLGVICYKFRSAATNKTKTL